jgi:hypothetical protein
MLQPLKSLVLLLTALALGGCASSLQIPDTAKGSIDAVSIGDTVVVTPNPQFISGIGRLIAPGIGGVAGAIIDSGERDKDKQYILFLKAAGIDVAPIVRSEFESQIRKHPFFGSRLSPAGKYRFEIDVPFHALVQKTSITNYYRANVGVRVKLIGPTGEVVGEGKAQSCLFGDCIKLYELEELLANPELLRQQYVEAARDAIQQVLKSL